ncbi:MAG: hypothetical protein CMI09_02385 [Oceanospirillaceae bacterium]|nr:hypothetical protein [Oceanospirillaceae bacterium]|tara:strand:+ start:675 stop:983 length:309 start_codon:yes stop_codon:yes gene_type:complete
MTFELLSEMFVTHHNAEHGTMMGTPCLRYKGEFVAMIFERADSLIVKLPAERVNELIATEQGNEFNFTKKRFREWVLIPRQHQDRYEEYMMEALEFARSKAK